MELTVEVTRRKGVAVVALRGQVDVFTAPQLRDRLYGLLASGETQVVLDLDGLTFCDSNGLSVLVSTLRRLTEAGGTLEIVCGNEAILRSLRSTGLVNVFSIRGSRNGAVDPKSAKASGSSSR